MHATYVRHMGDDAAVVDAARVSFDKLASMFNETQNASLIYFLARGMRSNEWERLCYDLCGVTDIVRAEQLILDIKRIPEHWVPFAHTAITLRMSAPVPIRTQCFKQKVGLVESEESRRYIKSRPVLFVPDVFRAAPESDVKQGSGGVHHRSENWKASYIRQCWNSIDLYEDMVKDGVAPEQARFVLPQGVEVQWIWTGNLYAFANYVCNRTSGHAQAEGKDLAMEVDAIIRPLFPVSWAALTQGLESSN